MKQPLNKLAREYRETGSKDIFSSARDNFIYGFVGAVLVVFIATEIDIAVLIGYLVYYFFLGRVVNRPKYVTSLGKFIVFPVPTSLGAFIGYKLAYLLADYI
tara:strand:- start:1472 stop:1777 length:306 start_codon:yes stop_codon:yes gene_type:complete